MKKVSLTFLLAWFFGCVVAANQTYAQTATLSGLAVDETGAVVSNVKLTLRNHSKSLERQLVTEADGSFAFLLLPPDTYTLRAQSEGFRALETPPLTLAASEARALRLVLSIAQFGEVVSIHERAASSANAEADTPGITLTNDFITSLPLNGRGLNALLALAPGVALTKATRDEQGQFSVHGLRANANYFSIDGVSANTSVTAHLSLGQAGAGALPGLNATGNTASLVSLEALQEVKVLTANYAAEFGRAAGGQILLTTRSGTRHFNGALYDYVRHYALDANDWFANRAGLPRAALRQHNFGGVLSGPIKLPGLPRFAASRPRTFFFFSYEALLLRQPQFATIAVPNLRVRQTVQAPALRALLNAYPLPNGAPLENGAATFAASYSDPTSQGAASLRLDHTFNSGASLFARYHDAPSRVSQRAASLSGSTLTEFQQRALTAGLTQRLAPNLSHELRANFTAATGSSIHHLDEFGGAIKPFAAAPNCLLLINVLGLPALALGQDVRNTQQQFNLTEQVAFAAEAHQFKFGLDYRRLTPRNRPRAYEQIVNFIGVAGQENFPPPVGTLLSGRAASAQVAARDAVGLLLQNLSAFAQDDWRVTPRLNVQLGVRWDVNPPPAGRNGQTLFTLAGLNSERLALAERGTPLWQTTYHNFAPRVGAAYQLTNATTLRGGFGLFYDTGYGVSAASGAAFPYHRDRYVFDLNGVAYPLSELQAAPPAFSLQAPYGSLESFAPDLQLPRVWQWNVTVAQAFNAQQSLTAAYVGTSGRALLRRELLRTTQPDFLGPLFVTRNAATSDYHALQIQWQRRLARGWQALANYRWARAVDLASNDSAALIPVDRLDPQLERGPADFDVRHTFSAALSYALPKWSLLNGWQLDTLWRAQSAAPFHVIYAGDLGFGFFTLRPDVLAGVTPFIADPNAPGGRRLNPAAFAQPLTARQGTLERNALRGFALWQVDVAVRREFALSQRAKLHVRAEFFNAPNHANFAEPRAALNAPLFGAADSLLHRGLGTGGASGGLNPVYQVGGPRAVQLVVRLAF